MPGEIFAPSFALMAQADMRPYSGASLFQRTPTMVTMPSFSGVGGGLFDDLLAFLNGRGSITGRALAEDILATWTLSGGAPTTVNAYINGVDRLVVESDLDFIITAANEPEWFGFNAAGQGAALVGGIYQIVAEADFTRGNLLGQTLWIDPVGAVGAFQLPSVATWAQDLPTLLNSSTGLTTLESLDRAANNVRWCIDATGRVGWIATVATPIIWQSTGFRDALGFDGTEAVQPVGGVFLSMATNPAPGVLIPSRPLTREINRVDQESTARRLIGGGWVGTHRGAYLRHALEWYLDGPADQEDFHQHWLREVLPRLSAGARCSFYSDFPETRARVAAPAPYSSTETAELERGRISGYVYDSAGSSSADWPRSLRRRAPMSIVIEEAEAL